MLKRRFIPYIVGVCIIAIISLSYVGYRAYEDHVEFQPLSDSLDSSSKKIPLAEEGRTEFEHEHTHHTQQRNRQASAVRGRNIVDSFGHSDEYVYEINGIPYYTNVPLSQEDLVAKEWQMTGKMSPAVEEAFKKIKSTSEVVTQRVVTPDGTLHEVVVPRNSQYEEGDAILAAEINPPISFETPENRVVLRIEDVAYAVPSEYLAIADPYEREEYFNKFVWSIENGISMEEVEKEVAQGELDFSLSDEQKQSIDEIEAIGERKRVVDAMYGPQPSDKPPVKVSFLRDEGNSRLPGWLQKEEDILLAGSGEVVGGGKHSGADTVSEGSIPLDTDTAPPRADVPVSPANRPDMVKPTPSPPSVADIENQLTPQGIEAELTEGLSTNPADKAQQFIDQYGTEEGLRRLRESDPDAARRFEQERRGEKTRSSPSSDSGQSPSAAP